MAMAAMTDDMGHGKVQARRRKTGAGAADRRSAGSGQRKDADEVQKHDDELLKPWLLVMGVHEGVAMTSDSNERTTMAMVLNCDENTATYCVLHTHLEERRPAEVTRPVGR